MSRARAVVGGRLVVGDGAQVGVGIVGIGDVGDGGAGVDGGGIFGEGVVRMGAGGGFDVGFGGDPVLADVFGGNDWRVGEELSVVCDLQAVGFLAGLFYEGGERFAVGAAVG